MIPLKTKNDIETMREGGVIALTALKKVLENIKPGIKLSELDRIADQYIIDSGGEASFKTVDGYSYATCINVNEGIVHGIPTDYELTTGDVVSIDLGVLYKGFHTDLSHTVEVGTDKEKVFLDTGKQALSNAISKLLVGNRIGDISQAIQSTVESVGYSVSRDLVGHGVGAELHEDPLVPGYGRKGEGPLIQEGLVLAIEVIYQRGSPRIEVDDDDWTIKTSDGSLSGLFEQTVAATKDGPVIITSF